MCRQAMRLIRNVLLVSIATLIATPAQAQLQTGGVSGVVSGADGMPLSGATVTLTGAQGPPQVQVTDAQGRFRYLGLTSGAYSLQVTLEGFADATLLNVRVSMGRSSPANIALTAAGPPVNVTAEAPLLDARPGTLTQDAGELEKIPTARDPWAILQQTPGVLMDRINVGGSENGQLLQATGPGGSADQTQWLVDGVNVTDPAAFGTPPVYLDFGSVEEIQVSPGGGDATVATPGVTINLVTKRGTNEWRGSGRFFLGGGGGVDQESNSSVGPNPLRTGLGSINDWGAELGGPIIRDRLWIWGSYGRQSLSLQSQGLDEVFDRDVNRGTLNINLDGTLGPNNRPSFSFFRTSRLNGGVSQNPIRAATAFDEESTPTGFRLEDTHIFSSNFYLTGLYSVVQGGFTVTPQGDQQPLLGNEGIERGYFQYDANRDQQQFRLDASSFFNTGSLSHELKFGAGYRDTAVSDTSGWDDNILIVPDNSSLFFFRTPETTRATDISYTSVYGQDTLTFGRFTLNVGLRYDGQSGSVGKSSISFPFNTSFPQLTFTSDESIEWSDISPRLGLTYALGAERGTLLRASFNRYADQLSFGPVSLLNPIGALEPAGSEAHQFIDLNNNRAFDANEPQTFLGYSTFAPNDVRLLQVENEVDENLNAPSTNELLFGVEHALLPEFVVGLNLTYRSFSDLLDKQFLVVDGGTTRPATALDYVNGSPLSGSFDIPGIGEGTYNVPTFTLRQNLTDAGGVFLTNGDRGQTYTGASLTFNKRLANRWMLRGNFTFSGWKWSGELDPSHDETSLTSRADGGPVAPAVSLTGRDAIFVNSQWSFFVNGVYQVAPDRPWAFNLSGNLYGRQGFPAPIFRVANGQSVPLVDVDKFRYDSPIIFDFQASKTVKVGQSDLALSIGAFNVFGTEAVLQRALDLDHASAGRAFDSVQPRVLRLGARLDFR